MVGPGQRDDDHPVLAIGLVLIATLIFPFMDGTAKYLAQTYSVTEVTWARYFFHLMVLLPLVLWRHPVRALLPKPVGPQILRGIFLLGGTLTFFAGLDFLPLVDMLALGFIAPLAITLASPFVLGERISVRRITAAAIGFVGALVILRPGFGVFQWPALFGVGTGIMIAAYDMLNRRIARSVPSAIAIVYTSVVGVAVLSAIVPFDWRAPTLPHWGLMLFMGASGAFCHWLLILAYERCEASLLAPFAYAELISATFVGYYFFGDFPDRLTWLGIAILVASGIYISYRERHLGLRRARPPETAT
jgi:drug/metabolite transporter (DMT)-like permease